MMPSTAKAVRRRLESVHRRLDAERERLREMFADTHIDEIGDIAELYRNLHTAIGYAGKALSMSDEALLARARGKVS